ncbi:MAG: C10 family peptidase, partial [Bacteroidia bacterium]|nr:C10 family peptidase [Bacteroidia bacterium]
MKRIGIFLFAISILGFNAFPGNVTTEKASQVAIRFISERISPDLFPGSTEIKVIETFAIRNHETPLYYIFNLNPEGWIAVAADDVVFPILAYSFEGAYRENNHAPQFTAWMKQYEDQIRYAIRENVPPFPQTEEMWSSLTDTGYRMPELRRSRFASLAASASCSDAEVSPLITTHWDQSPWYNEMCPADPVGPMGHCVAGCVPVCMAQVMYYFRWPETGIGSYTYTEPNYGVLTADFGATTYEWNEMTNSINRSNLAIAELIYHLGVSCDLQYGPDGSGMYNHKTAYSLRTFFKYAPETQYLYRDSTTLNWDSVLIAHLDRKIPMYYAGWSDPNISGHAFVCDGYQDSSFFHFNFGWGGSSDGYFYTSDLTPGGSNFNLAQEMVTNCFPDTVNYTYPVQCAGDLEFTQKMGSFEDGSGPVDDYLSTANCSWMIDPQTSADSVTSVTLSFDRIATNPADFVTVYDGETTSDPVLGAYSGELIPPEVTTTGSQLLVTFEAGSQLPDNGFLAHYKANMPVWCTGTTTIKSDTAEISDGSFDFNYYNSSMCKWKVETESGDPLTIHFKSFDTEEGKDFLTIYDLGTGDTLVSLSGHYTSGNMPDSVTAPSGKMFFIFMTNSTVTADGWEIYYPKKPNISVNELNGIRNLALFPNPASDRITVRFTSITASPVQLVVLTSDGRPVWEAKWEAQLGENGKEINLTGLKAGIYLVRMTSEDDTTMAKLIIQ